MTRSQTYVVAAAILAGSAIISLGLYAGLSASSEQGIAAREPPPAPAVAEVGRWPLPSGRPVQPAAPPLPPAARAPPPNGEPSLPELQRRAARDLLARLYADRATYLERCAPGSARQDQGSGQGSFAFDVVFDASGHEIARDIRASGGGSQDRNAAGAASSAEILDCLRGVGDLPASISPPGRSIEVSVTYPFP